MNPFDQLIAASRNRPTPFKPTSASKVGKMREALADGPKKCHELAKLIEVRPTIVSALFANDIKKGRVRRVGGTYELEPEGVAELRRELDVAASFLRRHGYTVTFPTG